MTTHKGNCMCGAVSVEVEGDPQGMAVCHCKMCRARIGSAAHLTTVQETGSHKCDLSGYEPASITVARKLQPSRPPSRTRPGARPCWDHVNHKVVQRPCI